MAKFKIGDKVIAKKDAPYKRTTNGWRGTVVDIGSNVVENGSPVEIKVEGVCSTDGIHAYWVNSKYFDLDIKENQRIVITTDGKATIARLYNGRNVVKFSESRCSPEDVFDFATGAKIAVDRLLGEHHEESNESLDWKAFKAGKIAVKVTKDNYKEFVKAARKHGCDWFDGNDFNPFKSGLSTLIRVFVDTNIEQNEIYITAEGKYLKITHFLGDMKKFVWR